MPIRENSFYSWLKKFHCSWIVVDLLERSLEAFSPGGSGTAVWKPRGALWQWSSLARSSGQAQRVLRTSLHASYVKNIFICRKHILHRRSRLCIWVNYEASPSFPQPSLCSPSHPRCAAGSLAGSLWHHNLQPIQW